MKLRASRLELQDREWDALFQHSSAKPRPKQPRTAPTTKSQPPSASAAAAGAAEADLEHARAVAQAKIIATRDGAPQQGGGGGGGEASSRQQREKRKTPATRRDEIFRSRRLDPSTNNKNYFRSGRAPAAEPQGNSFSRFLGNHQGVASALCFATPVRDDDDDDDDDAVPLNDADDDSTLNTCEDTITSTLYFDAKYSHLVEKRPPMPLFPHFKVSEEENHIRRIVATDSHNSLNLLRLMNHHQSRAQVQLEDTSSEEDETTPFSPPVKNVNQPMAQVLRHSIPRSSRRKSSQDDLPPEPVKINSSGSSKSTASTTPSSSSPPPPFSEAGRVVHL
jgi:hypothetical protein